MAQKGRYRKKCKKYYGKGGYLHSAKHNCCAWRGQHAMNTKNKIVLPDNK
jgi:hypothetical protein